MHLRTFMSAAMGSIGVLSVNEACNGNVAFRGEEDREDEGRGSKFMVDNAGWFETVMRIQFLRKRGERYFYETIQRITLT